MLIKVKSGMPERMIHEGVRYYFAEKEIKDCPESMLSAFRGILVQAEQPAVIPYMIKMPIIQVNDKQDKIVIKKKTSKKKKK